MKPFKKLILLLSLVTLFESCAMVRPQGGYYKNNSQLDQLSCNGERYVKQEKTRRTVTWLIILPTLAFLILKRP